MGEKISKQQSDIVLSEMMQRGITPEITKTLLESGMFADGKTLREYLKNISDLSPWVDQIRDDTDDLGKTLDDVFRVLSQVSTVAGVSGLKIFLRQLLD